MTDHDTSAQIAATIREKAGELESKGVAGRSVAGKYTIEIEKVNGAYQITSGNEIDLLMTCLGIQ